MRTILFDYPGSKLDSRLYALNMRVGYLLSGTVMCMGTNVDAYRLIEAAPRFTTAQKMKILMNHPGVASEFKEIGENIRSLRRQVKYQDGRMIIASKQMDNSIERYFEAWMHEVINSFYSKGFPAIGEYEENKVFEMRQLAPEPESNHDSHIPFSEWFQLTQEEDDAGDMVMMPANFMDHAAVKDNCLKASDPEAGNVNSIYFRHCITLPKISSLTILEMNSIRKAIAPALQSFTGLMNDWIDLFWNEDGGEADTTAFFNSTIQPAAERLQAAYDANLILKHLVRTTSATDQVQIFIGEAPVKSIWRYFRDNKIIPNATWQKLQKAVLRDDRLTKRWPIITVRSNDAMWSLPTWATVPEEEMETMENYA